MKLKTLKLSFLIMMALLFSNCEKGEAIVNEQNNVLQSVEQENKNDLDFTFLENVQDDGTLQKLEKEFVNNIETFNNLEELNSLVGDYEPDLNVINQYLRYRGKNEIDLNEYRRKGTEMIKNENTTAEEFASFLSSTGVYNNEQLKHFLQLDKKMNKELSKEEYLRNIDEFKENIINDAELDLVDKNIMLIYGTIVKSFYSTNHFEAQKNKCNDCIRRNGWRIFGWGVIYWLFTLIPCLFSGPIVIGCLIATAGYWALHNIHLMCGWACNWI